MNTTQSEPEFVTIADAARLCGVHRQTVRNWAYRGLVTRYRRVGDYRIWLRTDELRNVQSAEGSTFYPEQPPQPMPR